MRGVLIAWKTKLTIEGAKNIRVTHIDSPLYYMLLFVWIHSYIHIYIDAVVSPKYNESPYE